MIYLYIFSIQCCATFSIHSQFICSITNVKIPNKFQLFNINNNIFFSVVSLRSSCEPNEFMNNTQRIEAGNNSEQLFIRVLSCSKRVTWNAYAHCVILSNCSPSWTTKRKNDICASNKNKFWYWYLCLIIFFWMSKALIVRGTFEKC